MLSHSQPHTSATGSDGLSVCSHARAQAISRMHCILRDCDAELRDVSDAANTHGRKSEQFAAAGKRLGACQRRRYADLDAIEARCGPSQDAFRVCIQEHGGRQEHQCLRYLHPFLDCAERALNERGLAAAAAAATSVEGLATATGSGRQL